MPVHVICKFHKDLIKTKNAMLRTSSNMVFFWRSRASNSDMKLAGILTCLRFYGCPGYNTCKFEDDSIKGESAILRTFSPL